MPDAVTEKAALLPCGAAVGQTAADDLKLHRVAAEAAENCTLAPTPVRLMLPEFTTGPRNTRLPVARIVPWLVTAPET